MNVKELIDLKLFDVVYEGKNMEKKITTPFCCDLLSIAMSKMPVGAAWVTIMGNLNTLAVASLTDAACIILAEGIQLDEAAKNKLASQEITVLSTTQPIFVAALWIQERLYA